LYWVAPLTINSIENKVLPVPASPQINVGLPLGKPPSVISSSPVIPVGVFSRRGVVIFDFVDFIILSNDYQGLKIGKFGIQKDFIVEVLG
jgi:hypothetical protein